MKADELRKHSTCMLCRNRILAPGLPLFWRVTLERFGVNMAAVRRHDGLAAMLGSQALAGVMGGAEEVATPVVEPAVLTICERCALNSQLPVAVMDEIAKAGKL